MWSRHSRRIEPMSLSTYAFCQGATSSSSREARLRTRNESRETSAERIVTMPTTVWRCHSWHRHTVVGMITILSALVSLLSFRVRSRASLELELVALRHQVTVLRRQRPGQLRLFSTDRLIWVWLYRIWPRCLDTMVLVKPATVVQWHRQGFRLFWRWRSRSGRPSVDREICKLIRELSSANPLWGAPRIHGELLKLGIEISQATVAKYMVRRRGTPSQNWRSFLRNHAEGIAAIDMFVVASASFRLLYVMIILAHDRRT